MSRELEARLHLNGHDAEESARLHSCTLPVSAEAPAMAREAIGDLGDTLAPELLRDAKLLVSELVSHRVSRLSANGAGSLELDVTVTGPQVRVQVVDDANAGQGNGLGDPELGWQLQIVAQVADRWGIRRDGSTTVWFELDR